jgi:flagellar FliL protein
MADDTKGAEGTEAAADGGGKKKLAIVGVVALLFGGGAGFGAATFLGGGGGGDGEELAQADGEDTEGDAPAAEKHERAVVQLNDFTINLRGTGGGRVLRLKVSAEVDSSDADTVNERMDVLRDAVLTLASDYTYNDLEGIDGKMRLRDELLARLNASLESEARVKRVYFTEFVVQ